MKIETEYLNGCSGILGCAAGEKPGEISITLPSGRSRVARSTTWPGAGSIRGLLGRFAAAALLLGVLATPAGCSSNAQQTEEDALDVTPDSEHQKTVEMARFALTAAQSCDDVTLLWRKAAREYMEDKLEGYKQQMLHPDICYEIYDSWYGGWGDTYASADYSFPNEGGDDEKGGAKDYSTTNTQEVGVDEADFLKNDGAYIYILADNVFQIIDAWPPEQAHRLSTTVIEGAPRKLYVHDDVAVIFSSISSMKCAPGDDYCKKYGNVSNYNECTYGYDCEFTGDGMDSKISVFDITDLENPELVREIYADGSYLNSRRIEDFVYTIVYFPEPPMPPMEFYPDSLKEYLWACVEEGQDPDVPKALIESEFKALKEKNLKLIDEMPVKDWMPNVRDIWHVNGKAVEKPNPLDGCTGFYLSQTGDGMSLMSLLSFDLKKQENLQSSSVLSKPGAVYASKQSLFVATRHNQGQMNYWFGEMEGNPEATTVHEFLLSSTTPGTSYLGSGLVKGRILNQFAMSHYNGYLRMATTTGHLPSPSVHNTISVLGHKDGEKGLVLVGQLDNLAPSEDIRSVRFNGDLGFMVTFKKTDPLFVIDLSDPAKPEVKGELKIPGFSTYMHFLDPQHILSIGYDADDHGTFAYFDGIMLQVFDVTDITKPSLMHKEIIGTRGTTSDAATNHLAFNFFKPKSMLAIPMTVCEGGDDGSYGSQMTFNGLMVYKVTVQDGFKYQGGIVHQDIDDEPEEGWYDDYWYDSNCYNWWSSSNSTVKRSIFMDDFVFSVALDQIVIATLTDLEKTLATVSLLVD